MFDPHWVPHTCRLAPILFNAYLKKHLVMVSKSIESKLILISEFNFHLVLHIFDLVPDLSYAYISKYYVESG